MKHSKIEYRGFVMQYDWSEDDNLYIGTILKDNVFTSDVAGWSVDDVIKNFHEYINWCLNE